MDVKKRKVDSECRVFKEEWTWKYFFTLFKEKPVCLLCNTTVAVLKEYNIQRHFKSKHENHSYSSLSEEVKKIKSKDLIKNLSSQQQLFQRANHSQRCATKASYVLAYNIAKSNKAFSDGEFIKQCMIDVCDIMCPEKKNDFQSLSLSRRTITERIENIDKNLISQLTTKTQKFIFYSITMDESTDISDTAQLLIFVRGINAHFEITEELAGLQSIKGTTTGADIFCEFENCIDKLRLPIDKLCNVTTDGAPNMVGINQGFVGKFNSKYPENDVVFLHCLIHQDALCKSALDIDHILNIVVKLVNMIRSRGLLHRQFQQFLESVHAEHSDILYYSKVRWLSAGKVFERIWDLKDDIVNFLLDKDIYNQFDVLENETWLSDFAFFTDLLVHMNKLNLKLQGKNQFLHDIWQYLKSFKLQLLLFANQISKSDFSHFPRIQSLKFTISNNKIKKYEINLRKLSSEFERRFQDFRKMEPEFSIFATPFNVNYEEVDAKFQLELIELNCNTLLKQTFHTVPLLEFYKNLSPDNFPNLITHAMKIMTMFGSSYICEQIFSTMKLRKTSLRNRITDEHLSSVLRISASQMEPDYDEILMKQSQFHFSHAPSTSNDTRK